MKVFPTHDETFSLSKLVSTLQLMRNQHSIIQSHQLADKGDLRSQTQAGSCPACHVLLIPSAVTDDVADAICVPLPPAVADDVADAICVPLPPAVADDVAGSVRVSLSPVAADNTKRTRTIARTPSAETTSSGVNKRWYVITVGRETGVFQGWHNDHTHVIGVPGACFGYYTSRAAADTAYMQALRDGFVSQLLD